MKTEILQPNIEGISAAAAEIKNGGLVAFPTETVYGLGANALDAAAVKKIYQVKGRPSDNPLIVHLPRVEDIESVGILTAKAAKAAEIFMPGALTIVLKKRGIVPDAVSGGLPTVAVRIPSNPVALKLLTACRLPLAAPSANTSTRPSPTEAAHVFSDLNGKIKYILDGGRCDIGLESTIVDFSGETVRLLRHGGIPIEQLRNALGEIEEYRASGEKPLSPGMKYRHYAPDCKVVLIPYGDFCGAKDTYLTSVNSGIKTEVLLLSALNEELEKAEQNKIINQFNLKDLTVFSSLEEYANGLFSAFRRAEKRGTERLICMLAPDYGLGKSLNNRLFKASGGENER